jgi:hypothetical protein
MATKKQAPLGVGLDIGTMNIVSARRTDSGAVETSRMRDAFLDLDSGAKRMLKLSGVNFIDHGEEGIIVVGDAAMEMANVFGREARRPLSQGLISAGEMDALDVLGVMIKNVLGDPQKKSGEVCYFSVPASPVDEDRDVVYHRGVFERIISECGYEPYAGNEGMAIIYAETAAEGFSGLGISFGSGMCNLALAVSGVEGLCFSVARGGDWIDAGAGKATGSTQSRMCALKEKGVDLLNPEGREQEALVLYYKALVEYCIDQTTREFVKIKDRFSLPRPIPIVVSGGTSLAENFLPFFEQVFEKKRRKFPIDISEIRLASDPLNAVARGLLIQAMQEHEED